MKAVIVECSNGAAVALCDDGSFKKLKNKSYSIGQELLLKQKTTPNRMVQKLSICASLALFLLSFVGIGSYSYVKPYSYVSLDINPSIEYALNRYDKVISVSGINNEGQQVVSSIESDIRNQNITTALGVTIRQLEKENYIIEEAYNHVIVSVCSANNIKAQAIASRVDTFSEEESHVCSIDTVTVSKEVKENADSLGITPGKLALIHAVAETTSDSDFDVSEWTDKTVNELETTIQQASSQSSDSEQGPAGETVIDSDYLSSVLDDSAAQNSDSTATASAMEVDNETGSTITDKQTNTTNDTTTGSSVSDSVSTSKPDSAAPAATGSTAKTEDSGSTDKSASDGNTADSADNSGAADQDISAKNSDKNASSSKGTSDKNNASSSKDSESSDKNSGSSSKGTSSSSSKKGSDDALTEESSSKKDSYPASDTDTLEDSSNPAEEQTDVPDAAESDTAPAAEEPAAFD